MHATVSFENPGRQSGISPALVAGFVPDLRKRETRLNMAVLVKF